MANHTRKPKKSPLRAVVSPAADTTMLSPSSPRAEEIAVSLHPGSPRAPREFAATTPVIDYVGSALSNIEDGLREANFAIAGVHEDTAAGREVDVNELYPRLAGVIQALTYARMYLDDRNGAK